MYAWKFHRRDKFVIQSVTGGIRKYMECLNKFRIGARLSPRPIRIFFSHSIYSRIPPVTDCITNSVLQKGKECLLHQCASRVIHVMIGQYKY
jgi:hypothetical protein